MNDIHENDGLKINVLELLLLSFNRIYINRVEVVCILYSSVVKLGAYLSVKLDILGF